MITPKEAKRLTARKGHAYKMVCDSRGQDWLVGAVLDAGRLMELIRPDTNGQVRQRIDSSAYADYEIVLGEKDV